jgi:hypothetical protein
MTTPEPWLGSVWRLSEAQTRSVSAENPDGAPGGGARAVPGEDPHCSPAAAVLGRGWKVRPCLRNIGPQGTATLADVPGPGVVQHFWCTVRPEHLGGLRLRVRYDGQAPAAIDVPLGHFFANGIDGQAQVRSLPVAVNPRGGMNSYWPMPFRNRLHVEVLNEGDGAVPELFYQITYALCDLPRDVASLHAAFERRDGDVERPEHLILREAAGPGQYVGTYLVWHQSTPGWWGEGEVKFFIDGDPPDAPTICGTGTEDYFGGAWGFSADDPAQRRPVTYTGPLLGFPQHRERGPGDAENTLATHALYRWHLPDPIRFRRSLRATIQALGWGDDGRYRPLPDRISSLALWYASAAP